MNFKSIDKKKLFLASCKVLFWTIVFAFVFFKAIFDLILFILCVCDGEDDETDDSTGPYLNYATGELDAVKYVDGMYYD